MCLLAMAPERWRIDARLTLAFLTTDKAFQVDFVLNWIELR